MPSEARWLLESLNGNSPVDGASVTLGIYGDSYGGFDGCNHFGGKSEDGTPIAGPNGTFAFPDTVRTQALFGNSIMSNIHQRIFIGFLAPTLAFLNGRIAAGVTDSPGPCHAVVRMRRANRLRDRGVSFRTMSGAQWAKNLPAVPSVAFSLL